jgi:hypothetical protein
MMRSCNDDYVPIVLKLDLLPDPRLEEIDAKLEALYNDEITMEATLSEPEWYVRPDFADDDDEDAKNKIIMIKRHLEIPQTCSECHLEKIIIVYDFRCANDDLCSECVNMDCMSVYERKGLWS